MWKILSVFIKQTSKSHFKDNQLLKKIQQEYYGHFITSWLDKAFVGTVKNWTDYSTVTLSFFLTFSFLCDLTLNSGRMICLENFAISLLFSSGSLSISGKLVPEQSLTRVYIFHHYTPPRGIIFDEWRVKNGTSKRKFIHSFWYFLPKNHLFSRIQRKTHKNFFAGSANQYITSRDNNGFSNGGNCILGKYTPLNLNTLNPLICQ